MKISLKQRKLPSGKISLVIEYYKGSETTIEGKRKHIRDYENLKLYLTENPKTADEKKENKESLAKAEQVLAIRKTEYHSGRYNIKNTVKEKRRFLDFYREKAEEKISSPKNYGNWMACLTHLERCISHNTTFEEVNEDFIKKVRTYFSNHALTKSNTPLSPNSKYTYFNKVKAALSKAYEEGYINIHYASKIKSFVQAESQREYLTHDEVQNLIKTNCKYEILKSAFIFSCLTGLRWSDINTMTWSEVRDENGISRVNFRQEKTDQVEYLYISNQSRQLLGQRKGAKDLVFTGLKYSSTYNAELVRWCNRAGISKHITFHSARHTNAVLLLENGADIYTVSKRLGHKEIRTTTIYAKIVDKKMREAANLIPEFKL